MHVLQVNKFLYGGAGAETVMFRTADLLRSHGHEVSFFAMQDSRNVPCSESKYFPRGRYYDAERHGLGRVRDAASSIYSLNARTALRSLLRDKRPDIAHLHNVYHQLTLSVVDELVAQKIPTVMTLHDYKPVCPSYVLYTEGAPCHRCVNSHPGHTIKHKCIKGSRAASAVGTLEAAFVRVRKLYHKINAYISPSQFLADVMVEGGLPLDCLHVIPNFVADDQFCDEPSYSVKSTARPIVLFIGRLEEVKGVRVLLEAAKRIGKEVDVRIIGQGSLESEVEDAQRQGAVRYMGTRSWAEIASLLDEADAVLVPSLWEENCPMVALEAGARGRPIIASNRGGLKDLVEAGVDGLVCTPGNVDSLVEQVRKLADNRDLSQRLGKARLERMRTQNTAEAHYPKLQAIYHRLICN